MLLCKTTGVLSTFCANKNRQSTKRLLPVFILMNRVQRNFSVPMSCAQLLWVANRIITLNWDTEENPGPFTQTNNHKKVLCTKSVNTVSILETWLLELDRPPVNVGDENCFFFRAVLCQLYNTPQYHFYIRFLGVHHLCIPLGCI